MKKMLSLLALILGLAAGAAAEIETAGVDGTLTGADQTVKVFAEGMETTRFDLQGTFGAVVEVQAAITGTAQSTEASVVWRNVKFFPEGEASGVTSTSAAGLYSVSSSGFKLMRIKVASYTSGTIRVAMRAGKGTAPIIASAQSYGGSAASLFNYAQWIAGAGGYAANSLSPMAGVIVLGEPGFVQSINSKRTVIGFDTRTDTFSAAGTGAVLTLTAKALNSFALQVKGTGAAPTSFTVLLQGSLDGTNWTTILTSTNITPGDGVIVWQAVGSRTPALYLRNNVSALVLGSATDIVVRGLGLQ